MPPTTAPGFSGAARSRPDFSSEPLGFHVIQGVLAEGTRRTTTYPAGMVGNDRPITVVAETWTSPELKVVVLSRTLDPRSGEGVMRLENISRAEPDPALFRVPADYQIVDETGPFTIKITRP